LGAFWSELENGWKISVYGHSRAFDEASNKKDNLN